ncbi:MAG TPA: hypothetical protein PKD53_11015 [Chloroflexaceae bacterium]|nr:hypothetical protein [Chloroflexaceae bacterium]
MPPPSLPRPQLPLLLVALALVALLAAPAPAPGRAQAPATFATTGNLPWLTVLCRASDAAYPQADPVAWFSRLMTDQPPGFDSYWRELSYGAMTIAGSRVVGVYTLPGPADSYFELRNGARYLRSGVVSACLDAADPDVFFPDFAGFHVIFPGLPAYGGRVASEGGLTTLSRDGRQKDYGFTQIVVANPAHSYIAHEWAHALGLMHSGGPYASDYDSSWDVVSGGRFAPPCPNADPVYRCPGQHTIAYHKDRLGWIPAERILTVMPGTVHRVRLGQLATMPADPATYLYIKVPFSLYTEFGKGFYTIEARRQVGYDQSIPGNAVVVHTVDEFFNYFHRSAQVLDLDNNGNPNDAGAMWTPGETLVRSADGITLVMCVEAETASGFTLTVASNADACGVSIGRTFLPQLQR